jgi:hypothetical protein
LARQGGKKPKWGLARQRTSKKRNINAPGVTNTLIQTWTASYRYI